MSEASYLLFVTNGGDISGATVRVIRSSPYSQQEQNYIIGECVEEKDDTKVYSMQEI